MVMSSSKRPIKIGSNKRKKLTNYVKDGLVVYMDNIEDREALSWRKLSAVTFTYMELGELETDRLGTSSYQVTTNQYTQNV